MLLRPSTYHLRKLNIQFRGSTAFFITVRKHPNEGSKHKGHTHSVTLEEAKKASFLYNTMSNDILTLMASHGDQFAREERLIRNIMAVDEVEWDAAHKKFMVLRKVNREYMWLATIPYKVGLFTSLTFAFGSIPLIFDKSCVMWFNEVYVTADVPEPKDLATWLEVGSWSWNWMEPLLGHISFFLLCLQFARAQLQNLKWSPYSQFIAESRAERLHKRFPQYSKYVVKDFARTDGFTDNDKLKE